MTRRVLCLNQSEDFFKAADLGYLFGYFYVSAGIVEVHGINAGSDRTEYIGIKAVADHQRFICTGIVEFEGVFEYLPAGLESANRFRQHYMGEILFDVRVAEFTVLNFGKTIGDYGHGQVTGSAVFQQFAGIRHEYDFGRKNIQEIGVHIQSHFVRLNACMAEQMTESFHYQMILSDQSLSVL